jgi:hypothetical protein
LKEENDKSSYEWSIGQVFQPLAGEGLYVSLAEFKKYVEAVKGFWNVLGNAFDQLKY